MKYINHFGLLTEKDKEIINRELLISMHYLIGCVVEEYSNPWRDVLNDRYK